MARPADAAADRLTPCHFAYWIGLALIGAAVVSGLIEPILTLRRFVPLDPNEGWNAFFAQTAMRGGGLYPAPGSLIVNNYPPVSFYVVGVLGHWTGDNIFAGRLVALISMLVVVANVHVWLRSTGSTAFVAWLGAGLLAALAVTYAHRYAGMNDPQWLAHALMTTGMVVLWRGGASARAIVLGSLLMMAGGWTKHLLIPLPIATTAWLLRRSKTAASTWIVCSASLLAMISLAVWWLYGAAFFESLPSVRQHAWQHALRCTSQALAAFAPLLALTLLLPQRSRRLERYEFALAYLITSALVGAAASAGIGVDVNAFFDLMIASSLCAALTVEALGARSLPGSSGAIELGAALTLLLGIYLAVYAAILAPGMVRRVQGLDALERTTLEASRLIAAEGHGHAACEVLALCYWGKSEFVLDFFNFGQRLKVGREPSSVCDATLDGRDVPLVQLRPDYGQGSKQLPKECNEVILRNYRPVWTSSLGVIFASARPVAEALRGPW